MTLTEAYNKAKIINKSGNFVAKLKKHPYKDYLHLSSKINKNFQKVNKNKLKRDILGGLLVIFFLI